MNKPIFPINLYYKNNPGHIETLDLCRGNDDFRKVYIISEEQKKIVIKHCSNAFTDSEKINGWFRLAESYNKIGIYCPSCIPTLSGKSIYRYTENNRDYYVYAEEYAPFKTVPQIGRKNLNDATGQPIYLADLMRSVGKVASAHFDLLSWPSQFCLLEEHPYGSTDETTLAATKFSEIIKNTCPEFRKRMENILALFLNLQTVIKTIYDQLPTSCFQGDLNDSNILLNKDFQFVGVIDFNVCGREPVLNYAIREALMHIENSVLFDEDGNELYFYNDELEKIRMRSFKKNIEYISEFYHFNAYEKYAFPLLYRYISSFWWEQVHALKQFSYDKTKVEKILNWIELQLTRQDIYLL